MAKVGDKVQWTIRKSRRGNLIVCGLEDVYKGYTNDEIRQLMVKRDGRNVIEGYVSKVYPDGKVAQWGVPALV